MRFISMALASVGACGLNTVVAANITEELADGYGG
jgi:hypothetical protein